VPSRSYGVIFIGGVGRVCPGRDVERTCGWISHISKGLGVAILVLRDRGGGRDATRLCTGSEVERSVERRRGWRLGSGSGSSGVSTHKKEAPAAEFCCNGFEIGVRGGMRARFG
jgi:hypothetical protein